MTTPRRSKNHHNRPQAATQPSDYESDLNAASTVPFPRQTRTNGELNLSVLRRHNVAVESILSIAPYAVVYVFTSPTQQWEKSDIEGTLFVCQLSAEEMKPEAERYAVMILNRRGLQNFTAELLNGEDVEITEEYVILQVNEGKQEPQIYGIWIFSEPSPSSTADARSINAQIIQDCATQAKASRKPASELQEEQSMQAQEEQLPKEDSEEPTGSVSMGRQLSLRELFGKQREQDSGWSGAHHGPSDVASQFLLSTDTQFFRSTARPSQQEKQQKGTGQER